MQTRTRCDIRARCKMQEQAVRLWKRTTRSSRGVISPTMCPIKATDGGTMVSSTKAPSCLLTRSSLAPRPSPLYHTPRLGLSSTCVKSTLPSSTAPCTSAAPRSLARRRAAKYWGVATAARMYRSSSHNHGGRAQGGMDVVTVTIWTPIYQRSSSTSIPASAPTTRPSTSTRCPSTCRMSRTPAAERRGRSTSSVVLVTRSSTYRRNRRPTRLWCAMTCGGWASTSA
mmetsp:Transcript_18646/g.43440  ORF Transcript_18646/g.43440 Transcript_18646/m.43440 type:complete len:227 (+) Transcript_18646:1601-2281(+)